MLILKHKRDNDALLKFYLKDFKKWKWSDKQYLPFFVGILVFVSVNQVQLYMCVCLYIYVWVYIHIYVKYIKYIFSVNYKGYVQIYV